MINYNTDHLLTDKSPADSVISDTSVAVRKKAKKKLFNARETSLCVTEDKLSTTAHRKGKKKSGSLEKALSVIDTINVEDEGDFCAGGEELATLPTDPPHTNSDTEDAITKVLNLTRACAKRRNANSESVQTDTNCDSSSTANVCPQEEQLPMADVELNIDMDDLPVCLESEGGDIPGVSSDHDDESSSDSPVFQTQCRHGTQRKLALCSTFRRVENTKLERVKTPPPIEDVAMAMESLDRRGHVSPVDVLELIDKWNSDMAEGVIDNCKRTLKLDGSDAPALPSLTELADWKLNTSVNELHSTDVEPQPHNPVSRNKEVGTRVPVDVTNTCTTDEDSIGKVSTVPVTPSVVQSKSPQTSVTPVSVTERRLSIVDTNKETELSNMVPDTEFVYDDVSEDLEGFNAQNLSVAQQEASPVKPFGNYCEGSDDVQKVTSHWSGVDGGSGISRDSSNKVTPPAAVSMPVDEQDSPVFCTPVSNRIKSRTVSFSVVKATTFPSKSNTPAVNGSVNTSDDHDSFFSSHGADDSLLAAIQTPKVTDGSLFTPGKPGDMTNSQITFTQALHCVNESSLGSTNSSMASPAALELSPMSVSTKDNSGGVSPERPLADDQDTTDSHQSIQCDKPVHPPAVTPPSVTPPVSSKPTVHTSSVLEEVAEPQFDLGFDLDELDDDMVPPSPPAPTQPFSQRSQSNSVRSQTSLLADLSIQKPPSLHTSREDSSFLSQSCLIGGLRGVAGRRSSLDQSPESAPFTAIREKTTPTEDKLCEATDTRMDDMETMQAFLNDDDDDLLGYNNLDQETAEQEDEEESQSILAPPSQKRSSIMPEKAVTHQSYTTAHRDDTEQEESQSLLATPSQHRPAAPSHTSRDVLVNPGDPLTAGFRLSQERPVARVTPRASERCHSGPPKSPDKHDEGQSVHLHYFQAGIQC